MGHSLRYNGSIKEAGEFGQNKMISQSHFPFIGSNGDNLTNHMLKNSIHLYIIWQKTAWMFSVYIYHSRKKFNAGCQIYLCAHIWI